MAAPHHRGPAAGPGRHRRRRPAPHRRRRRAGGRAGRRRRAVGYRTTVRVAADPDGRAGFRAERSHDVVAAPECLVAHRRSPRCCRSCGSTRRRGDPAHVGRDRRAGARWDQRERRRPGAAAAGRRRGRRRPSTRTSPGAACGCRWARSSNPVRRPPNCSPPRSGAARPSSPAPASSSTPTPGWACSPRASTRPRRPRDRDRDVAVGGRRCPHNLERPRGRHRARRGGWLARAGRPRRRRGPRRPGAQRARAARSDRARPHGAPGARAGELRPGVARPRHQAARPRRLRPRAHGGRRHVPAHDPRRGRSRGSCGRVAPD